MIITTKTVAAKLDAYLHDRLTLAQLVDWAETAMMEGEFEAKHHDQIRDTVARLGLADVRAFGLTWEDCKQFIARLGYAAQIKIVFAHASPSAALVREKPAKYGK
jgi:hypothetical protein